MVGEYYLASLPDRGGRITVEWVAECSWNRWPDHRGLGGRMCVDWVAECAWNTHIDSVIGAPAPALAPAVAMAVDDPVVDDVEDDEDDDELKPGNACMVHIQDAVTSNQTLIQWLPRKKTIVDLLAASAEERTQLQTAAVRALIRVTYQMQVNVTWQGMTETWTGRTLEEAFALENLVWCQDKQHADLKLRIPKNTELNIGQLAKRLHKRINGSSFNKTDFALALLAQDPMSWTVPTYIAQGLQWLQDEVKHLPVPLPPTPATLEVTE